MTNPMPELLPQQIDALLTDEPNNVANLANAAALLMQNVSDINWAGFYIYNTNTNQLDLGPFQGNVACMHIQNGQGVCGTAFAAHKILRIQDVHQFKGHIACDSASNSEIVLPLSVAGEPFGVLDIDSAEFDRFSETDAEILAAFALNLQKHLAI